MRSLPSIPILPWTLTLLLTGFAGSGLALNETETETEIEIEIETETETETKIETKTCDELRNEDRSKRQESLLLEAVLRLQRDYELVQHTLDEIHGLLQSADASPPPEAELQANIEELLTQSQDAHGHIELLMRRTQRYLKTVPGKGPKGAEAVDKMQAAGVYLENILAVRSTPPHMRLWNYADYSQDLRRTVNLLVDEAPALTETLRQLTQAIHSAMVSATTLKQIAGEGYDPMELEQEFGPYGDYALSPSIQATRQQLEILRRELHLAVSDLTERLKADCGAGPRQADEERLRRAWKEAFDACDGPESEPQRSETADALRASTAAWQEFNAAAQHFREVRARFRQGFSPDTRLQGIETDLERYRLALAKRQEDIDDLDRQAETAAQETTDASQSFLEDLRDLRAREGRKMDRVAAEVGRLEARRDHRLQLRSQALLNLRAAASRLEEAAKVATDAQSVATQAACALDRCPRSHLLQALSPDAWKTEAAGRTLPILPAVTCADLSYADP